MDATPPVVDAMEPPDQAKDVDVIANIQITFSESMNETATADAFSPLDDGNRIAGAFEWSNDGKTMTFYPERDLEEGRTYRVVVTGSARDIVGYTLPNTFETSFTTIKAEGLGFVEQFLPIFVPLIVTATIIVLLAWRIRRRKQSEADIPGKESKQ